MSTPQTSAPRWSELDRRQRRREVTHTTIAVVVAWVVLFGAYYLVPFTDRSSAGSVVRLVLGIAAFVLVLLLQARRVAQDDLPTLRADPRPRRDHPPAARGLRHRLPLPRPGPTTHFSEPLNHTGALYLAITVFSTVGFGDITPESDLARVVVSGQMLLDLVVIGAVVRILTTAAKSGRERSDQPSV